MPQANIFVICLLAAALGAHAQTPDTGAQPNGDVPPSPAVAESVTAAPAPVTPVPVTPVSSAESADQAKAPSTPELAQQPRIIRGNDMVIAPANTNGLVAGISAGLKFEDAPVADVVSLILREIAKVDYIVHPPITGNVTLSTQGDVTADQAVLLLEAALQANGLQMARDTRGTYHIGRPDIIKGMVPAVRQAVGGPLPPGYGAVIIPLKYIGAAEMASILRPMSSPDAILRVDTVRNLLVMAGTRNQAEGWLDIVSTFDVDMLKGMSVGIFPLKHVSTLEVETALRLLSAGTSTTQSTPSTGTPPSGTTSLPGSSGTSGGGTATPTSLSPSFPLYGALRIVPIERMNSVMVVTPRAAYLDEARRWLEKLDQPGGNSPDAQLFVYPVQNGNAKHLANVLNGLFGNDTAVSSTTQNSNGVAPSLKATTASTAGFFNTSSSSTATGAGTSAQAATDNTAQSNGLTTVATKSGLRVMADDINNAILVYGKRSEYEKVESTLRQLDVSPNQVLIEASIIEVTLTDELKYGLQWMFTDKARGSSGLVGTGVLSTAAGAALGATPAGFSYTLRNSAGDVRAVLNALADKSLVKVISSPSLMVLDNHNANISVGNQQPVQTGTTVTTGGNVTSNIEYKDTGVSLSVTPSVNAGNMITMKLTQAVTDVGTVDVPTGQRSFLQRQFASTVAVRSGESLVLGGLIRDNTTTGKSGLPGLVDIPLIGSLFGSTTKSTNRTELVVVITPRVVRTEVDVREVGQDLKNRMKMLYPPPEPAFETQAAGKINHK